MRGENKTRKIISIFALFVFLIGLSGCSFEQEEKRAIEEKIDSEIEYMEDEIFAIVDKHIKKEYFENEKFLWDNVKGDMQKINNSWCTLELDFTQINLDSDKISECGKNINDLLLSVSLKNEDNFLNQLYEIDKNLYDLKEEYTEDKNSVKKMRLRGYAFKTYYYAYKNDNENAKNQVKNLQEYYKELMNDENYKEENFYNLNKIALLIEEYNIAIQTGNIDLTRMKYLNLSNNI